MAQKILDVVLKNAVSFLLIIKSMLPKLSVLDSNGHNSVKDSLDDSFMSLLSNMRYGQKNIQRWQKKKKCQVQPGKSVVSSSENEVTAYLHCIRSQLGGKHGKFAIITSSEVDELVPVDLVESDANGDGEEVCDNLYTSVRLQDGDCLLYTSRCV